MGFAKRDFSSVRLVRADYDLIHPETDAPEADGLVLNQEYAETKNAMANTLLPIEERNLTPDEVERLDKRRRRGQLFLVLCFQSLIVATLLTLWSGQDLTLSPGLAHPVVYWNAITFAAALVFGIVGIRLKRGSNEFISY